MDAVKQLEPSGSTIVSSVMEISFYRRLAGSVMRFVITARESDSTAQSVSCPNDHPGLPPRYWITSDAICREIPGSSMNSASHIKIAKSFMNISSMN